MNEMIVIMIQIRLNLKIKQIEAEKNGDQNINQTNCVIV